MNKFEELDAQEMISNLGTDNLKFAGKRVLLVGCGGFLGTVLTNYFLALNKELLKDFPVKVTLVDNYIIGNTPKIYEDANFTAINHDVCLPFDLKLNPHHDVNYILNFAGIASPSVYVKFPIATMDISYIGTKNILNLAYQKNSQSVICMSSSEIYGNPPTDQIPTKETDNGNLSSIGERACYDTGKFLLETLCDIYHRNYGVPVKIIRPFNCFGAGMSIKDKRIISAAFSEVAKGNPIQIYGKGHETRTFCYVTDFLTGTIKLLLSNHNGEIFNLGNDNPEIAMRDVASKIAEIAGGTVEHLEYPPVYKKQPLRRCPDLSKAKKLLGYEPKISLEDGLKRYYEYVKSLTTF